jgi:hypothetical protein
VTVLACDVDCRALGAPESASMRRAEEVATFLESVPPAGATDLVVALRRAVRALDGRGERDGVVLYVGDGMATVGHRRLSDLAAESAALARPGLAIGAVAVGGDADTAALGAIARAGGGHLVPYTPGYTPEASALAVLETTFGASLERPTLELPPGVEEVSPAELPTVRAGGEVLVAARFRGEVRGEAVLRGTVAGRPFEARYPLALRPSDARGNAFVPRLWAAMTIERFELAGRGEDQPRIVALSQAFGVLSRHTSLLVLESEAMFRAFGVDRARASLAWTGDEAGEMVEADGTLAAAAEGGAPDESEEDAASVAGPIAGHRWDTGAGYDRSDGAAAYDQGLMGTRGSGRSASAPATAPRTSAGAPSRSIEGGGVKAPTSAPVPSAVAPEPVPDAPRREIAADEKRDARARKTRPADDGLVLEQVPPPPPAPPPPSEPPPPDPRQSGQWMRKVWYAEATIARYDGPTSAARQAAWDAERALAERPDSRERHRALVQALAFAGDVDRAAQTAESWVARDRLDPEALGHVADLLARQGWRADAIRTLSGVVDLQPDATALHLRLARALERGGLGERACAHRVTLAELLPADVDAIGRAVRCLRGVGRDAAAERQLAAVGTAETRERARLRAVQPDPDERRRGNLVLEAGWDAPVDVDVAIIAPDGSRVSWLGGRVDVFGASATAIGREHLGLGRLRRGTYLVEVTRPDASDRTPVRGTIEVVAHGARRTLPFELLGERATVGRIKVESRSRLVPADGPPGPLCQGGRCR